MARINLTPQQLSAFLDRIRERAVHRDGSAEQRARDLVGEATRLRAANETLMCSSAFDHGAAHDSVRGSLIDRESQGPVVRAPGA
jgi:hypothetical protein